MRSIPKQNDKSQEISKELEELAPTLSGIPKKEPHEVADFYFSTLTDKVVKRAKHEPQLSQKWIDVFEAWVTRLLSPSVLKAAVAVVIIGTVTLNLYQFTNTGLNTAQPSFADLEQEELDWLLEQDGSAAVLFELTDTELDALGEASAFATPTGATSNTLDDDLFWEDINESLILEEIL